LVEIRGNELGFLLDRVGARLQQGHRIRSLRIKTDHYAYEEPELHEQDISGLIPLLHRELGPEDDHQFIVLRPSRSIYTTRKDGSQLAISHAPHEHTQLERDSISGDQVETLYWIHGWPVLTRLNLERLPTTGTLNEARLMRALLAHPELQDVCSLPQPSYMTSQASEFKGLHWDDHEAYWLRLLDSSKQLKRLCLGVLSIEEDPETAGLFHHHSACLITFGSSRFLDRVASLASLQDVQLSVMYPVTHAQLVALENVHHLQIYSGMAEHEATRKETREKQQAEWVRTETLHQIGLKNPDLITLKLYLNAHQIRSHKELKNSYSVPVPHKTLQTLVFPTHSKTVSLQEVQQLRQSMITTGPVMLTLFLGAERVYHHRRCKPYQQKTFQAQIAEWTGAPSHVSFFQTWQDKHKRAPHVFPLDQPISAADALRCPLLVEEKKQEKKELVQKKATEAEPLLLTKPSAPEKTVPTVRKKILETPFPPQHVRWTDREEKELDQYLDDVSQEAQQDLQDQVQDEMDTRACDDVVHAQEIRQRLKRLDLPLILHTRNDHAQLRRLRVDWNGLQQHWVIQAWMVQRDDLLLHRFRVVMQRLWQQLQVQTSESLFAAPVEWQVCRLNEEL
jgi:hypothetical protein